MPLSMPRSSMGLPISGSRTCLRAARTCSSVGVTTYPDSHGVDLNNIRGTAMSDPTGLEIHKALADDTRYRLYRYLGLSGRPVSVRELSKRLSLHPNTVRPHLRRLEEAGLVSRELRRASGTVGRPETLYSAAEVRTGDGRDYRLLAEMLCGLVRERRDVQRATGLAREWGRYLVTQRGAKPGV